MSRGTSTSWNIIQPLKIQAFQADLMPWEIAVNISLNCKKVVDAE